MYFTQNRTTVTIGSATATVIADTKLPMHSRITTLELVYPRIIHSEFMTHRMFSRNASSSRATPVRTMIKEVQEHPFIPKTFRKNQKGMVAAGPIYGEDEAACKTAYMSALGSAIASASALADLGVAKEQVNRLLEPYAFIRVLVTATDWDNFFRLRLAKDAQPEIQDLAKAMKCAMGASFPEECSWHVPYVGREEIRAALKRHDPSVFYMSAARCARVSYMRHDGKAPTLSEDIELATRLYKSGHMTPFEHIAHLVGWCGDTYANFDCWQSARWQFEHVHDDGERWCPIP